MSDYYIEQYSSLVDLGYLQALGHYSQPQLKTQQHGAQLTCRSNMQNDLKKDQSSSAAVPEHQVWSMDLQMIL